MAAASSGIAALGKWTPADADEARLSVQDFFKYAALVNVRLAPDSRSILGVRFVNGRRNLSVVDLQTRKAVIITNFRDADVSGADWVNANRIILSVVDLSRGGGDQAGAGRLFAIDRDGANYRPITGEGLPLASGSLHSRVVENSKLTDEVFVAVESMQAQGQFASNLYRVNTKTARASLATLGGPGRVSQWVVDRNNVPRAALAQDGGKSTFYYRDSAEAPWKVVLEYRNDEPQNAVVPLGFDGSGVLYLTANMGKDLAAIHRFDTKVGAPEPQPIVSLKDFDLTGGLVFDPEDFQLLGIRYEAEKPSTHWVDKDWGELQKVIDQALPDRVNLLSGKIREKDAPILVVTYSDQDPARYLLFDRQKRQLQQIAASMPWIDAKTMAQTSFVRYKARDGLSIPAQLTLPRGSDKKNLPLVVLHYGGPWVRAIHWGFDPAVQFLASRGYAVLMPAPRASTGYGLRHFQAGWKQWGLAMQDDVTDGVRWLIAQGTVDSKRICIAGASYGGYLTMMGLAKEPELFRCGINWVGVTDPSFMFTVTWTDFNRVDSGRFTLPVLIGDPDKDAEQFKRTSPLRRAAEIKQPVMMAYGGLDQRVPIVNGDRMRDALKGHNKNVEWYVYADEGHGWLKEENNIDFWTHVEAFLAKNLAPTA
jgi:dipeptidyl aminopeptidase/acylaminoacyl peptidase